MSHRFLFLTVIILVVFFVLNKKLNLSEIFEIKESNASTLLKAFPGAEGFGSDTQGGRGGKIIKVTNLNDSGPGSLRDAVENQSGPRIVVFKVSGVIQADSIIYINNSNITIAGQTALGDGIVVKGSPFFIRTHDVIIRGMKMRIGDQTGTQGTNRDGITAWGDVNHKIYNIIIDHNSIAWAIDENTSIYDESSNQNTITFSWNIIAEALHCSIHVDEEANSPSCHSMGMLIESPQGNISVHHNLFASNNDRNPAIQSGNVELINNIIYNWGLSPSGITGGNMNAMGNNYISTPGSSIWIGPKVAGIHCEGSPGKVFLSGNVGPGGNDWDTVACTGSLKSQIRSDTQIFTGSGTVVSSATRAYTDVLAGAGATRDSVDSRIISYVQNRTKPASGWLINSQDDVGGWPSYPTVTRTDDVDDDGMPDSFEQFHGGNLNVNDVAPSGYTWIEEYINGFFPSGDIPLTACVCSSNNTCSDACTFDKFTDLNYSNPIKCNQDSNVLASIPTADQKNNWCRSTLRTKGDVDGKNGVNNMDYFYYVQAVNGGKIPSSVNLDADGDGVISTFDRSIIMRSQMINR